MLQKIACTAGRRWSSNTELSSQSKTCICGWWPGSTDVVYWCIVRPTVGGNGELRGVVQKVVGWVSVPAALVKEEECCGCYWKHISKLELRPINMYFMVLPKVFRPFQDTCFQHRRSFCVKIIPAASLPSWLCCCEQKCLCRLFAMRDLHIVNASPYP